jgi:hypothetical protein
MFNSWMPSGCSCQDAGHGNATLSRRRQQHPCDHYHDIHWRRLASHNNLLQYAREMLTFARKTRITL